MIAHNKHRVIRHLEGQFYIAFTQCLFGNIGLINKLVVDIYIAAGVNIDPFARLSDDSLDENLASVINSDDVACFKLRAFDRKHYIALSQRGRHRIAVNSHYRQQHSRHKHGNGRGYHKSIYR